MRKIGKGLSLGLILMTIGAFLCVNPAYTLSKLRVPLGVNDKAKKLNLILQLSSDNPNTEALDERLQELDGFTDIVSIIEAIFAKKGLRIEIEKDYWLPRVKIIREKDERSIGCCSFYVDAGNNRLEINELEIETNSYRGKRLFPLIFRWIFAQSYFQSRFSEWDIYGGHLSYSAAKALWRSSANDRRLICRENNKIIREIKEIEKGKTYRINCQFPLGEPSEIASREEVKKRLLEIFDLYPDLEKVKEVYSEVVTGKLVYPEETAGRFEIKDAGFETDEIERSRTELVLIEKDDLSFCDVWLRQLVIAKNFKKNNVIGSAIAFDSCLNAIFKGEKDGKDVIAFAHLNAPLGWRATYLRYVLDRVEELKLKNPHVYFNLRDWVLGLEDEKAIVEIIKSASLQTFPTIFTAVRNGKIEIDKRDTVAQIISTVKGMTIHYDREKPIVKLWDHIGASLLNIDKALRSKALLINL